MRWHFQEWSSLSWCALPLQTGSLLIGFCWHAPILPSRPGPIFLSSIRLGLESPACGVSSKHRCEGLYGTCLRYHSCSERPSIDEAGPHWLCSWLAPDPPPALRPGRLRRPLHAPRVCSCSWIQDSIGLTPTRDIFERMRCELSSLRSFVHSEGLRVSWRWIQAIEVWFLYSSLQSGLGRPSNESCLSPSVHRRNRCRYIH